MRTKKSKNLSAKTHKSKNLLYIAAAVVVLGIVFISTKDISPKVERVEQPLENSFLR